ncbi:hypothetical protein EK904_009063 [Melospiza melodia maxima]|nr:hypothetical protein EK904_009063 [Melospiza melodia maxima]
MVLEQGQAELAYTVVQREFAGKLNTGHESQDKGVGYNGCLLPAKPLHQLCVQLLDLCYLTRETIYDTLLKIAIENSTPSKLQIAKFLTVKEDFMLLAVGVISTGVFILSPGHWEQAVEHLNCITGITAQSILEFSYAVVRRVVGSTTPEQHRGTRSPQDRIPPQK